MPKAVAVLQGDSDSLVKSIKKAKDEMLSLEKGGKTLSRQLKDVANEADKAAGSLVHRIGGTTAIKAIGGVGVAMTGLNAAWGMFSSSMNSFAATQGAKGAKAMADLDDSINGLNGQLFTAVMGSDDMEEAGHRLVSITDTLSGTYQTLLFPLTLLGGLFRELTTDQSQNAQMTVRLRKAEEAYQVSLANTQASIANADKMYGGVERTLIALLGTKKELAMFELDQQAATIHAAVIAAETAKMQKKNAEITLAMDRAEAKERAKAGFSSYEAAFPSLARKKIDMVRDAAREEAMAVAKQEDKAQDEQIERMRQGLQRIDKLKKDLAAGKTTETPVNVSSAVEKAEEQAEKAAKELAKSIRFQIRGVTEDIAAEPARAMARSLASAMAGSVAQTAGDLATAKNFTEQTTKLFGDATAAQVQSYRDAKTQQEIADIEAFNAARQRAIEEHDMTFDLTQDALKWGEEKRSKDKAAADEKVAGIEAAAKEYAQLAADQIASGEKASKVAEKMARKALGGQISALGDKAMAEAAILAAALNPLALPMAAAGVAAYTAAAALGSDAKKAASSTPAAPAAPQQMNTNVSYNLQVDAAFANGESIARQFAMAQREAQRRGMAPAGAF